MTRFLLLAAACALLAPALAAAGGNGETAAPEAGAAAAAAPTTGAEGLAPGQYNLDEYLRRTGADITFSDSPYLAGRGQPPVEERLPANPLVMETWMEHGRYGGTLTWTEYTIDHDTYLRHLNAVEAAGDRALGVQPPLRLPRRDDPALHHRDLGAERRRHAVHVSDSGGAAVVGRRAGDHRRRALRVRRRVLQRGDHAALPRWANWGGTPVEVEIIDDYSFSLTFAKPYGLFLGQVTQQPAGWFMRPGHYMRQFHKDYTAMADLLPVMKEQGYDTAEWGKFYTSVRWPAATRRTTFPRAIRTRSRRRRCTRGT